MKTYTAHFYNDPGHGWMAVKRELLHTLGVADKISPYSYQRGKTVYLEEDCDAYTVCMALKAQGYKIEVVDHHTDRRSPIRSYARYTKEN